MSVVFGVKGGAALPISRSLDSIFAMKSPVQEKAGSPAEQRARFAAKPGVSSVRKRYSIASDEHLSSLPHKSFRLTLFLSEESPMVPRPIGLGLTLCDYVIVEERTHKVSLIGGSSGIRATRFPAQTQVFSVFAVLTDAVGDGDAELSIVHEETDQQLYVFR